MQTSVPTFGTWPLANLPVRLSAPLGPPPAKSLVAGPVQPAAGSLGAFADAPLAKSSRLVHARVQHFTQPDGYSAARFRRRLVSRYISNGVSK